MAKVGKSTGRNLRFLHFRARYTLYQIVSSYHTFTQNFLFLLRQKDCLCISAAAADANNEQRFSGYRRSYERQRRKTQVDSSYVAKTDMFCDRVVQSHLITT